MQRIALLLVFLLGASHAYSQSLDGRQTSVVQTGVPFLTIAPDSRGSGMGDVGVATSPDAYNTHWNPSKIAFAENSTVGFSYSPWLNQIADDIHLTYLSGYHSIDELSGFGLSMRYFSLGDITFTDQHGDWLGDHRPREFSIDGSYSRKLSDRFALGVGLRYIFSDLAGDFEAGNATSTPGQSVSGDISAFYTWESEFFDREGDWNLGANISNLGAKIRYTEDTESSFLPANLRLGVTRETKLDEFNDLNVSVDINKLLVPTNPVEDEQTGEIVEGKDPDVPVIQGVFQSFYDAPDGFSESVKEYMPSVGVEWWYNEQLAGRLGYFYEHPDKGNRQFLSAGLGIQYNVLGFDFSYLVPTNREADRPHPLENTLRFSLSLDIDERGLGALDGTDDEASAHRHRF